MLDTRIAEIEQWFNTASPTEFVLGVRGKAKYLLERLAAVTAALNEAQRWIPVGERLPTAADADMFQDVEVMHSSGRMNVWYYGYIRQDNPEITHWRKTTRPLPSAPENAERDRLCVVQPCALDDTVYMAYEGEIATLTVSEIRQTRFGLIIVAKDSSGGTWSFAEECIGRTAFFDRAQAEAAKEAQRAADNR